MGVVVGAEGCSRRYTVDPSKRPPPIPQNQAVKETEAAGFKSGIDLPCPSHHDGPGNRNHVCQVVGPRALEVCRALPACGVSRDDKTDGTCDTRRSLRASCALPASANL